MHPAALMPTQTAGLPARDLREALRKLAKSVAVITSSHGGIRYAMSATAVCELSFEPCSMLICVNRSASIYAALSAGAPFVINLLHSSQAGIATRCSGIIKGEERFLEGDWRETHGVPRLAGAQASIACENVRQFQHGTHGLFIGNVLDVFSRDSSDPLVYVDGRYTRIRETLAQLS